MHHRLGIASICLFALFTASCGGGGGSTPEESRVDDVVAFLEGNGTEGNGMELPEAETRCVAEALVAGLESDLLDEVLAGNLDDDPPPGSEAVFLDALFGCAAMQQFMIDSMVADGATLEEAECVAEAFDDDIMRTIMTSELTGEDPDPAMEEELMSAFFRVMMTCGGFDE